MIEDKISYILVTETLSLVPLRPSRLIKMLRWTRAISFTLYIIYIFVIGSLKDIRKRKSTYALFKSRGGGSHFLQESIKP